MRTIKLTAKDTKDLVISLKKIIGQLQTLSQQIEYENINDQTFVQLLAAKGGISRICKDIISKGVLNKLTEYSPADLNKALDIIFKI